VCNCVCVISTLKLDLTLKKRVPVLRHWRSPHKDKQQTLVSTGNMFQDLPRLCEATDNTESYI